MLAIRAAGFFDGQTHHDGPVLILVTAGKITEIDRTGAAPPREAELADLGPLTVLPGFVDAHTHLAWDPHGKHEHLVTDTEAAPVRTRPAATPSPRCESASPPCATSATAPTSRCGSAMTTTARRC